MRTIHQSLVWFFAQSGCEKINKNIGKIKANEVSSPYEVVIAQWLALRLATGEVPGSNPGKGEKVLISD